MWATRPLRLDTDWNWGETLAKCPGRMHVMNKERFSSIFKVGEIIDSGGRADRANSARLKILAIENDFIEYQSIKSQSRKKFPYSYLDVVLQGFNRIDPDSIQRSIQPVLLDAGLEENYWTENYAYGFAKEIRRRLALLACPGSEGL